MVIAIALTAFTLMNLFFYMSMVVTDNQDIESGPFTSILVVAIDAALLCWIYSAIGGTGFFKTYAIFSAFTWAWSVFGGFVRGAVYYPVLLMIVGVSMNALLTIKLWQLV